MVASPAVDPWNEAIDVSPNSDPWHEATDVSPNSGKVSEQVGNV